MGIRLMQLTDYEQLVELWQPNGMAHDFEYLEAVLARNPTSCFVYEKDGQIVAAACGLWDGRRGTINSVATLPEEQGNGYGTAVMEAVIDALLTLGTNRVRLFVVKGNEKVLPFYEKLGFEVIEDAYYLGLKIPQLEH
ncbi:MAG: GNAT family N-acetyltransferase [Anaerolineae bacterium]|jgi:ribosomal protein S18 acetylase RimI-like enzyme|nr:GNAT family N-acetyltransferase [Anaerolineae bacterium]